MWTQGLLGHLKSLKKLSEKDDAKYVFDLVRLNYRHTSIDKDVHGYAAERDNWQTGNYLDLVSKLLSG
jgi:hypothetical protein